MSHNSEERKEYVRKWRKKNPNYQIEYKKKNPEKHKEYQRKWYIKKAKKKDPNYKPSKGLNAFHDYETHHQLAMSSGIRSEREWTECFQRGFMPDGIYSYPAKAFKRSE